MKKIGILTLYPTHNYGGILQCVALYTYLKSLNYEPILIKRLQHTPFWKKIVINTLLKIPLHNYKGIKSIARDIKEHKLFLNKYISRQTESMLNQSQLQQLCEHYKLDAVIVGSDQVWRMAYIKNGHYSNFFLDFVQSPRTKKIAYAASFGTSDWEDVESIEHVTKLIAKFDAISVREKSGVDICSNIFNKLDVKHVLDPTFIVDPILYDEIITNHTNKFNLTTYILDESIMKKDIIDKINNYLFHSSDINNLNCYKGNDAFISIDHWLSSFKYSSYVITDSFHGMVFSILFNKQFVVIANKERGLDRFTSLLSILGLDQRLLSDINHIDEIINVKINYEKINKKIIELKLYSTNFLKEALK